MFTNLYYVHTDWHRGHENYCRDKIHLIANQKPGDVYFANRRNPQLVEYTRPYAENRRWYNEAEVFMPKTAFCTGERKNWRISGN